MPDDNDDDLYSALEELTRDAIEALHNHGFFDDDQREYLLDRLDDEEDE